MTARAHDFPSGGLALASLPASPQGPDHLFLFWHGSEEGRRMASEDSQHLGWFPMVHRLSDLRDLDDSIHREMPAELHELNDGCELLEVVTLRSSQRVFQEERHDHVAEVAEPLHAIPKEILAVIVAPTVQENLAAAEESHELFEDVTTRFALHDSKFGANLPSKGHLAAPVDGAAKAAFSIYETHDPSDGLEPFLLVFRTPRIVTPLHSRTVTIGSDIKASSWGYSGFPAYSRLRTAQSPVRGAAPPCLPGGFLP